MAKARSSELQEAGLISEFLNSEHTIRIRELYKREREKMMEEKEQARVIKKKALENKLQPMDVDGLSRINMEIAHIRKEVARLEGLERERQLKPGPYLFQANQWKTRYGEPKRAPSKYEQFLSFTIPASQLVKGAKSKDGTVYFPSTKSNAVFLRRGNLI